jgi:hypothetical protein
MDPEKPEGYSSSSKKSNKDAKEKYVSLLLCIMFKLF